MSQAVIQHFAKSYVLQQGFLWNETKAVVRNSRISPRCLEIIDPRIRTVRNKWLIWVSFPSISLSDFRSTEACNKFPEVLDVWMKCRDSLSLLWTSSRSLKVSENKSVWIPEFIIRLICLAAEHDLIALLNGICDSMKWWKGLNTTFDNSGKLCHSLNGINHKARCLYCARSSGHAWLINLKSKIEIPSLQTDVYFQLYGVSEFVYMNDYSIRLETRIPVMHRHFTVAQII